MGDLSQGIPFAHTLTRTGTLSLTNIAVRVSEPAAEGEHLRLEIKPMAAPAIGPDQCLSEVSAAGRDGTHARYLMVEAASVPEKPSTISREEAGAVGVPFITAYEGLREAGGVQASDVVLVSGGATARSDRPRSSSRRWLGQGCSWSNAVRSPSWDTPAAPST